MVKLQRDGDGLPPNLVPGFERESGCLSVIRWPTVAEVPAEA